MKKKQISEKEGEKYAESIYAIFSKTSSDIKNLFENIVLKIIDIKEQKIVSKKMKIKKKRRNKKIKKIRIRK